jgi:hypothetical protein
MQSEQKEQKNIAFEIEIAPACALTPGKEAALKNRLVPERPDDWITLDKIEEKLKRAEEIRRMRQPRLKTDERINICRERKNSMEQAKTQQSDFRLQKAEENRANARLQMIEKIKEHFVKVETIRTQQKNKDIELKMTLEERLAARLERATNNRQKRIESVKSKA